MATTDPIPGSVPAPYGSNANGPAYTTPADRERLHRETNEALRRELRPAGVPPNRRTVDPCLRSHERRKATMFVAL